MRLLVPPPTRPEQRGAALMLAILVLFVLVLIVFQITLGSSTDARVAQNDLELTVFDSAIESALIKTMQDLADDGASGEEADAGGAGGAAGAGGNPFAAGAGLAAGEGADPSGGAVDSRQDDWARPQQTEINGASLRILIQDEDSKYNILTMLTKDPEEAQKAFDRVVRILDMCRDGTLSDIDEATAREMAEGMLEFMRNRDNAPIPRPALLTDVDGVDDIGLPLTLREFVVLPGFNEFMFRDYRDADGTIVHSIGSFLTISTSVSTYKQYRDDLEEQSGGAALPPADGPQATTGTSTNADGIGSSGADTEDISAGGGSGGLEEVAAGGNGEAGVAVNVNTAPNAVLHGISDRQDIPWDFLDELVRYRNEEDEEATDPDAEPIYDEYGEEIVTLQIFESLEELAEVEGWDYIEPEARDDFKRFLTVESSVFSIFITARASSAANEEDTVGLSRAEAEQLAEKGTDRVRSVRVLVWRYKDGDEFKVVPLEPWEVLDYVPYQVLDYPEESR